ncbi:nucleotidyltransferase domain-containing protein [Caldalkalibacillus salinus]|uniref:nucleotidyltransferase domain-containing protein n=1 Tax=Caldalkalibacillus salinus TaxID=2803787 RepID=UPI001923F1A2|nr:nucleotidyltransferase domain-containing protein [Caldalkalibacillus salinus]
MRQDWKEALSEFLEDWVDKDEVEAVLVCGSYITGNPSKRSDIDVHIILSENTSWRERGNRVVRGFLIEYFINPPTQIIRYFKDDYKNYSTMSMVQFLTGVVILDKTGITKRLKAEAKIWKDKKYEDLSNVIKEIKKYSLWDSYDNLLDCYEERRQDFNFVYFNFMNFIFSEYCRFLKLEQIPVYQISSYLSEPSYLDRYLKDEFPDPYFAEMFLKGIKLNDKKKMMNMYRNLIEHVFEQVGGFNIDGWKVRSDVQS